MKRNTRSSTSRSKKQKLEPDETECCTTIQADITADELFTSIEPIYKKPWEYWTQIEQGDIIVKLRCRGCINLRDSTKESVQVYDVFYPEWEIF
jgi:hypothetical protein